MILHPWNSMCLLIAVNNVTIAIPHRGVPKVARDPHNGLLQPQVRFCEPVSVSVADSRYRTYKMLGLMQLWPQSQA
jgi:hypothetical protein